MTHLCLSFVNPDEQGNLSFANNADPRLVINSAQAAGVKVFLSLAGGGLEEHSAPMPSVAQAASWPQRRVAQATRCKYQ